MKLHDEFDTRVGRASVESPKRYSMVTSHRRLVNDGLEIAVAIPSVLTRWSIEIDRVGREALLVLVVEQSSAKLLECLAMKLDDVLVGQPSHGCFVRPEDNSPTP